MPARVQPSSGNVFTDLGFSAEEAQKLKIRSDLMIELTNLIEARELTQAAAAKLLGVTQPRISDLVRGKIDRFSLDTLIEMLGSCRCQRLVRRDAPPQGGIAVLHAAASSSSGAPPRPFPLATAPGALGVKPAVLARRAAAGSRSSRRCASPRRATSTTGRCRW